MIFLNLLFLVLICKVSTTTFYFQATLNCRIQQYWYYEANFYEYDPTFNDYICTSRRLYFNGGNYKTSYCMGTQTGDGIMDNKLYEPMAKIYHNCTKDSTDKMEKIYFLEKPTKSEKHYFGIKWNLDDSKSLAITQ